MDLVHSVHRDPLACAHNPGDMLATHDDAEDLYRAWDGHWQRNGYGYWVVRRRDDGESLGFCGVKVMRFHGREILNLFYRLAPSAWGSGYATEAATAVVGWASIHVPDRPLIARVRPDNIASLRVAAHAGLQRTAHLDGPGADGLDWIFTARWPDAPVQPDTRT